MEIEIDDETYQFFVQETLELLQRLEEGLLTLTQEHSINKLYNLMRAAHSIKGGAACVGLTGVQNIAHELENAFKALYNEDVEFDQELEDLLLQAYDCLRSPLMEQLQSGQCETDRDLEKITLICAQIEAKLGHSLAEETKLPEMEMSVDITKFIFTEEIGQGLTRWEILLNNPNAPKLGEELKAQAEVFVSLGELLNLPIFVAIAKTTISALQTNPGQAKIIGKLAAADFRQVQAAVLHNKILPQELPSNQLINFTQASLPSLKINSTNKDQSLEKSSLYHDLEQPSQQLATNLESTAFTSSSLLEELENVSSQIFSQLDSYYSESSLLEDLENGSISPSAETDNKTQSISKSAPSNTSQPLLSVPNPSISQLSLKQASNNHIDGNVTAKEPIVAPADPLPKNTIDQPVKPEPLLENKAPKIEPVDITKDNNFLSMPDVPVEVEANTKLGVRVTLDRLDILNNLVGDLVTQENSFFLQNQQNKELLETISQKLNRFQKLSRTIHNWEREWGTGNKEQEKKSIANSQFLLPNLQDPNTLAQTMAEEIAQLQESLQDLALTYQQVQQIIKKRQQTLKQVQTNFLQARMLPLGDLLKQFPRMVRDLAIKNKKQVNLQLSGMSTLVDRAILEKIYDPLIQLVRNSLDHGIEAPEIREKQGKTPAGLISIRAYHRGNNTYIQVQDDGNGINLDKIRAFIVKRNFLSAEQASILPKNRLYEYLFAPGFSTASKTSQISGRGVGLEAVRLQVSSLKGAISVLSEPGKGTAFTLRLPFTLTITKLLIFNAQTNFLAIPVDSLVAIAAPSEKEIEIHQGHEFYAWQGKLIPIYSSSLISTYNYPRKMATYEQSRSAYSWQQSGKIPLLIISSGTQIIALKIDQILMEQDLVIKPFTDVMIPPPYLYACTILGDGRLVPVIDGPQLVGWLQQQKPIQINPTWMPPILPNLKSLTIPSIPTVLVIDDSVTIRKSLSLTLSKGGYQVIQARNGWEGIEQLQQQTEIKAIICDIEMPQMNGFEFLSRCRKEFGKRNLPIIMLTSRSSEKYQSLAKQLGATAYLTKPYLDKKLLSTIQQCLELVNS